MKLLHLEDNDGDAALFEAILLREWPKSDIKRVSTRREFETAVALENYDVILSDYSMAGFDGLSALDVARSTCPDTPFLFLSGTIGEERAIEALKRGAVDYVLKDSPARLLPAVRSALMHGQLEISKRHAEESLRRSREQFRQIAESVDDFIVLLDQQGHCLFANPPLRRLLGKRDNAPGFEIFRDVHPEDRNRLTAALDAARQAFAPDLEYRIVLPDGSVRHLEGRLSCPQQGDNDVPTLLLASRDVTERRAAVRLLREQASLLDKARDAILVMDLDFKVTYWNASATKIFGRPSIAAVGSNLRETLFSSQTARFDTVFALTIAQGDWHGEFRLTHASGRDLVVESSWSLVTDSHGQAKGILCINTDLTKRKQLEQELQRAQRIDSLGMLAGGIAHDLNNILSPILMSVGLLRPLAVDGDTRIVLDTLETSATHGAELVRQILLFARGDEGQRGEVRIGRFLEELKGFLKATLRTKINLAIEYDPEISSVSADATQLKQVLLNLCVNSRDAMPTGGRVRITAENVQVTPGTDRGFRGEIPTGRYVRLTVADTGTGIPPEVIEKIFDPFFTTKELGKGTGLGLSSIAGIVQSHGGAIKVESTCGVGTTFHIYLPALTAPERRTPHENSHPAPQAHGEVVLVVDDDSGILMVTERILSSQGYTVLTASDGPQALQIFRAERDRISAVISDHMMPGMTGSELMSHIHGEAPHVGLIVMSGLGENLRQTAPELASYVTILPKPIKLDAILSNLRRVISAAPTAELSARF